MSDVEIKGGRREYDPEIVAVARISPATWALVITLIATLAGWGTATYANSQSIERHERTLETKIDKEVGEQLLKRMDDMRDDVRELRELVREEAAIHHQRGK